MIKYFDLYAPRWIALSLYGYPWVDSSMAHWIALLNIYHWDATVQISYMICAAVKSEVVTQSRQSI